MIAIYVSAQNDCYFCQTVHGAVAAQHWDGNEQLVQQTKLDFEGAPISEKLKALLTVAGKVQKRGKQVTTEGVAREQGATDKEIHETVLIAADLCVYNRYVDGLATRAPDQPEIYRASGKRLAGEGYVNSVDRPGLAQKQNA
jgi:AhpD family alkylhydroperoxidase